MARIAPGYDLPGDPRFSVSFGRDDGFRFETNLDMAGVTRVHQQAFGTENEVSVSHFLSTLASVYEDMPSILPVTSPCRRCGPS